MNRPLVLLTWALVCLVPAETLANDRLPARYRAAYGVGIGEARKYVRYILGKVFAGRLAALRAQRTSRRALALQAEEAVDEIVHIVLPKGKKIADDVLFGTGETYLRITMPQRRGLAQNAIKPLPTGKPANPGEMVQQAIDQVGGTFERELSDRIKQALVEDLEDLVQKEVEGAVGLTVVGRPRGMPRPLPAKWEERYAKVRADVHTFDYWWLRKKRRMQLTRLAAASTPQELDKARHDGRIWGLLSAASQDTWAQNRVRMDFAWGHLNWQIDRRRIRRRMDQDLAQGTWALAKLVKELNAPATKSAVRRFLDRRVKEELSKEPLRQRAEQYPTSARELQKTLDRLQGEVDPILNKAMARAKLPGLPGELKELAHEHGRRYVRDESSTDLSSAIERHAAPMAAAKRVRNRLPALVESSLLRFDFGAGRAARETLQRRATKHVRREIDPLVDEEIESALRDGGRDEELLGKDSRRKAIERVRRGHGIDHEIERQVERSLQGGR